MNTILAGAALVLLAALAYALAEYNRLVGMRNMLETTLSQVGVLMKKRADWWKSLPCSCPLTLLTREHC